MVSATRENSMFIKFGMMKPLLSQLILHSGMTFLNLSSMTIMKMVYIAVAIMSVTGPL